MVVLIEEKQKTLEYQEKMNVDIENISSFKIYFGDQYMKLLKIHIFKKQNYFQYNCLNQCRNNPNNPQSIPNEIKSALKKMSIEHRLYTKVGMIHRKESENKKERENTKKYNFQGQPAR